MPPVFRDERDQILYTFTAIEKLKNYKLESLLSVLITEKSILGMSFTTTPRPPPSPTNPSFCFANFEILNKILVQIFAPLSMFLFKIWFKL
jgi:hypothetical protein